MMRTICLFLITICCFTTSFAQSVKFAVISDIHQDLMCDCESRLKTFLNAAEKANVDFIIDLGDFAFPKKENENFLNLWKNCPIEKFHAIGNHDAETCSKQEYMDYVGMKSRYYSFDKGGIHFIVLDPNNLNLDGKYVPYNHGNFFVDSHKRAFVDPEQVEWLKKDLQQTNKRCIIFSHQSLEMCVGNRKEIRTILENENKKAGYTKVVACLNGHHHTNYEKVINGIAYIQINSASSQWTGDLCKCTTRFAPSEYKRHPALKYLLPWKDCLYAIVTINSKGLDLKGIESEFIPPVPQNMKELEEACQVPVVPYIKDYQLKFKN